MGMTPPPPPFQKRFKKKNNRLLSDIRINNYSNTIYTDMYKNIIVIQIILKIDLMNQIQRYALNTYSLVDLKIIYIHFFQSATTDRSKAKFMYILSTLVFISASSSKYPAMQCFFLISIINGKLRKQLRKLYKKMKNKKTNIKERFNVISILSYKFVKCLFPRLARGNIL